VPAHVLVLDAAEGIGPWARDALAQAGLACALVKENVEALRSVDAPVAGPGAVFASTACPAASHSPTCLHPVPAREPRPQRGPAEPQRVSQRQRGVNSSGMTCDDGWWA
jgi:hypothetical protein